MRQVWHSRGSGVLPVMLGAALALASAAVTAAQPYPERALRLVVPFAPVGSTDTLARIVGQRLSEALGQPVIVDNRAAAGGVVGSELVARAQPDGHTLLVGSIATLVIAKAVHPKLPYDPVADFAHVGLWVTFPLALVVPAQSPISGIRDLIDRAKAKPLTLRFGAQGLGTSSHVFSELMNSMAGIKVVTVPYKGGGPALTGVLSGEVEYGMVAVSTALAQVAAGKARALAVTGAKPTPHLPNVPPIASVVPGYEALNFHGLHAPARTPAAIIARLHDETLKVLRRPDVVERLNGLAMDIDAGTPEQYRDFIRAQTTRWVPLIRAAGVRAE